MNSLLFILRAGALLLTLWGLYKLTGIQVTRDHNRGDWLISRPSSKRRWLHSFTLMLGLALSAITMSAVSVPPTHIGVVENTLKGTLSTIGPGTHFWPFSSSITPLMTNVTQYDLRRQPIEIGGDPVRENGVEGDSNSPGRPIVFLWARGWAYPNPAKITDLHRQHGPNYADNWVERNWQTSLKTVSGQHPYDYVGNFRGLMTSEVETDLQEQLKDPADDKELVFVSQLAIVDFGYDTPIETKLQEVADREFERVKAAKQVEINEQNQLSTMIDATTAYSQTLMAALAESEKLRTEAQGQADAIRSIQDALANSPAYTEYQRVNRWDGKYPQYYMGGGGSVGTLLTIPPMSSAPPNPN